MWNVHSKFQGRLRTAATALALCSFSMNLNSSANALEILGIGEKGKDVTTTVAIPIPKEIGAMSDSYLKAYIDAIFDSFKFKGTKEQIAKFRCVFVDAFFKQAKEAKHAQGVTLGIPFYSTNDPNDRSLLIIAFALYPKDSSKIDPKNKGAFGEQTGAVVKAHELGHLASIVTLGQNIPHKAPDGRLLTGEERAGEYRRMIHESNQRYHEAVGPTDKDTKKLQQEGKLSDPASQTEMKTKGREAGKNTLKADKAYREAAKNEDTATESAPRKEPEQTQDAKPKHSKTKVRSATRKTSQAAPTSETHGRVLRVTPSHGSSCSHTTTSDASGSAFDLPVLSDLPVPVSVPQEPVSVTSRAGGGASFSRVDVNSNFNIGTVVSGGRELPVARISNYIDRGGVDLDGSFAIAQPGFVLSGNTRSAINFGVSHASGSMSGLGSATVGANGVTVVGLTFLTPDGGLGTGLSTGAAGDRLQGNVQLHNDWTLAHVGIRESSSPEGENGPEYRFGAAVTFEQFTQDFSSRADIIRAGVSLAGQETRAETQDNYYGLEFSAGVTVPVTDDMSIGVDGFVTPSIHTGTASISQITDFGAGVTQNMRFSDTDLAVSGGVRAFAEYDITSSVSFLMSYEYSLLGGVSEVHVPANPNGQPATFDTGTVERHFGRAQINIALSSDRRLKRDIVPVHRFENGLKLYRFRYLWSDKVYVGVIAQEVAAIAPGAVVRGYDGYLLVKYDHLGLSMKSWDAWLKSDRNRSIHLFEHEPYRTTVVYSQP